jgi:hypothetical protein
LLAPVPRIAEEHPMPESVVWMIVYFALAVLAIVAIFFFAMRFVSATRARSVRLKWQERRPK